MKLKHFYILIIIFISGCNEFIDITGKFINRLNSSDEINCTLTVSVQNLRSEHLANIIISIIDDHDSLLITSSKFTNVNDPIIFSMPDELIRNVSSEAQNLIIIAEHPEMGVYFNIIPISSISNDPNIIREFIIDIPQETLSRSNLEKYQFYNRTQKKYFY